MEFRHPAFTDLRTPELLEEHARRSKAIIRRIRERREFSQYDTFNKRFKLNLGMQIDYVHEMTGVTRAETQLVYKYMLKISDLWGAFEHLCQTCHEQEVIRTLSQSKTNLYDEAQQRELGFDRAVAAFNQVLQEELYPNKRYKVEMYRVLAYLKNNTKGGTQKEIGRIHESVKAYAPLSFQQVNALAYALRNLYVHKGVAASLGTKSMTFKVLLYSMLYEYLVVCCYRLGVGYCGGCGEEE